MTLSLVVLDVDNCTGEDHRQDASSDVRFVEASNSIVVKYKLSSMYI